MLQAGIIRIDSSIKTYVYCILGAQAQTRTRILEDTTGLETQQQLISLVEDCINTTVDIPAEVDRYQKALEKAGAKLDFVFGINLYLAPSNMTLDIGRQIIGYNNEIMVASDNLSIGHNEQINSQIIPQNPSTNEKGVVQTQDKPTTTAKTASKPANS